jgi:acyl-coenzyme A thioesterase PaaI-like protein
MSERNEPDGKRESRVTVAEFRDLLKEGMPSAASMSFDLASLTYGEALVLSTAGEGDLRPGGTVSGPTLFALADLAMYAAVLSAIGRVPRAVTTDATVHFLRRPRAGVLLTRAKLLKVGRRLVVGDAVIAAEGEDESPVFHAIMTYSVPA